MARELELGLQWNEERYGSIFDFCDRILFRPRGWQTKALLEAQQEFRDIVIFGDRADGKTIISCVIAAWELHKKQLQVVVLTPTKMQGEAWRHTFHALFPQTPRGFDIEPTKIRYVTKLEGLQGSPPFLLIVEAAERMPLDFRGDRSVRVFNEASSR